MSSARPPITVLSNFPRVDRVELPSFVTHVPISSASYFALVRAYLSNRREERCFVFNGLSRKVWAIALAFTAMSLFALFPVPFQDLWDSLFGGWRHEWTTGEIASLAIGDHALRVPHR